MSYNLIKFSHKYEKLKSLNGEIVRIATLVGVFQIELIEQCRQFLNYDTDHGIYKLPCIGKYLLLLFLKNGEANLFTTLRRLTPTKYDYYHERIGQEFEVVINNEIGG